MSELKFYAPGRRSGDGAAGLRRHQPRGAGGVHPRRLTHLTGARRRRCRAPAGRRAAASGPGGRRRAARPRRSCRPRRWASARGASCRSRGRRTACSPCSRHCRAAVRKRSSPVASASTLAAATASQSTQCMRAPTTGRSSQSSVYGKPGCPSAAQPRAAAASNRATASASSQSGGSGATARRCRHRRAHSNWCPTVTPYGRNGSAGRSRLYSGTGSHSAVKCSGSRQSPLPRPAVDDALGGAQRLRAQVPGGLGIDRLEGVRRGQRRLDAVHVRVDPAVAVEPPPRPVPLLDRQPGVVVPEPGLPDRRRPRAAAPRRRAPRPSSPSSRRAARRRARRPPSRRRPCSRASRRARRRAAGPSVSAPTPCRSRSPAPGRPSSWASPKTCVIRATIQVSSGRSASTGPSAPR